MGRSLVSDLQVQPQYLKDLVWPSLFVLTTSAALKRSALLHQLCFWQTRKYQSLPEFTLLSHSPSLNLKGHMIDGYLRTMTWRGPARAAGHCHGKCADFVFLLYKMTSPTACEGRPGEAPIRERLVGCQMWCRVGARWLSALMSLSVSTWAWRVIQLRQTVGLLRSWPANRSDKNSFQSPAQFCLLLGLHQLHYNWWLKGSTWHKGPMWQRRPRNRRLTRHTVRQADEIKEHMKQYKQNNAALVSWFMST